jgi:hypothetical protein
MFSMPELSQLAFAVGAASTTAAVCLVGYVVFQGQKNAHPSEHHNPDWMVVLLRLYKKHLIVIAILWLVAIAAFVSGEICKALAA